VKAPSRTTDPADPSPPGKGGGVIRLSVNGEEREVPRGSSAADLVVAAGLAGRPLAVEVNERIVPRRDLPACMLNDGDRIEIVTLVGGG